MSVCLSIHRLNHTPIHLSTSKSVSVYVFNKCEEEFTTIIIIIVLTIKIFRAAFSKYDFLLSLLCLFSFVVFFYLCIFLITCTGSVTGLMPAN